jgi:Na+/pantothenate symporter
MEPEVIFVVYIGVVLAIQGIRNAGHATRTNGILAIIGVTLLYVTTLYNPFQGYNEIDILLQAARPIIDALAVLPRGTGATVSERLVNLLWIGVTADGILHLASKALAAIGAWTGVNTSNGGCSGSRTRDLSHPLQQPTSFLLPELWCCQRNI